MKEGCNELDEFEYFTNKRPDRTYISKSFTSKNFSDFGKKMRIISSVFDSDEFVGFANIKEEIVLRRSRGERQELKILFYEDERKMKTITIQKFSEKNNSPHKVSFTFAGDEIEKIYNILHFIKYIDLDNEEKKHLNNQMIDDWVSEEEKRKYFLSNIELVSEIARNHITKSDVVALAYRKKQLNLFEKLLNDPLFFDSKKQELGGIGDEAVWQKFFEDNSWIFGYGLNYIFTSQLNGKKLEQVTSGHTFLESGKRPDALMKTRGYISSLCFVEIKTHRTPLLNQSREPYRSESWSISSDLAGSIAQMQRTVQKAIRSIAPKIEPESSDGYPSGETVFLFQPKAYIVIGCLQQFIKDNKFNEQKFSSFELFRRNIINPEIITFDELYERTKFIVHHSETPSLQELDPFDPNDNSLTV